MKYSREDVVKGLRSIQSYLATKEIVWWSDGFTANSTSFFKRAENPDYREFNMLSFHQKLVDQKSNDCGTSCCIGGWLYFELEHGGSIPKVFDDDDKTIPPFIFNMKSKYPTLNDLFFPENGIDYESITPEQAIEAIDRWIENDKVIWRNIEGVIFEEFYIEDEDEDEDENEVEYFDELRLVDFEKEGEV